MEQLALNPLVAVLAAGNCAVIKPSEVSAASCRLLAQLIPRYLSADAVRVVVGGPSEAKALLELQWDHILYTGNGSVGRVVMAAAARHLTPVTLELGGKNPAIVDATANVGLAAKRIAQAKWVANAGQVCVSPDYVLVDRRVEAALLDALANEARAMLGEGRGAHGLGVTGEEADLVAYGRIINEQHVCRIARLVEGSGGTVLLGRVGDIEPESRYVPPLIVSRPRPESPLMREEIFGPVLPVVPVSSVDEAIERARHICESPLALYIFSEERSTQELVLRSLPSGGVTVNGAMEHMTTPEMPFGGVGSSGMGAYHGRFGFDEFSHKRAILYRTTRLPLTMLPPVLSNGRVPSWLYAVALRVQVLGVVPAKWLGLLRVVAAAAGVLGVACLVPWAKRVLLFVERHATASRLQ